MTALEYGCDLLGWQGGTIHQLTEEVKRHSRQGGRVTRFSLGAHECLINRYNVLTVYLPGHGEKSRIPLTFKDWLASLFNREVL